MYHLNHYTVQNITVHMIQQQNIYYNMNKLRNIFSNTRSISTTTNCSTSPINSTKNRFIRMNQYTSAALVATAATALYAAYTNNTAAQSHSITTAATAASNNNNTSNNSVIQPFSGPSDMELELMSNVISNKPIDAVTGVAVDTGIRILNDSTINSILSRHTSVLPINRGHVESIEISWYQANHPRIEDTFSIVPSMNVSSGMLIGVFDGHSGNSASQFCRNELLQYLQYYKSIDTTNQSLINTIPFIHADHDFLDYSWIDGVYDNGLAGACAVTVHIDNNIINTANIGDCRAVIARRNNNKSNISYTAVELTRDHQIDTNEAEKQRLLTEHPHERDVIHRNRVKGRLQPTRGMGDGIYKRNEYYNYKCQQLGKTLSQYGWTAPYITAEPEITSHELQSADDYLIVSTDGLFQDLSSQQVVSYVAEYINTQKSNNNSTNDYSSGISSYLLRKSLLHAANRLPHAYRVDESTALSSLLQLPVGFRRNLHDDMTIVVCKLNHDGTLPPDTPFSNNVQSQLTPTLQRAIHDPDRNNRLIQHEQQIQNIKSNAKIPAKL